MCQLCQIGSHQTLITERIKIKVKPFLNLSSRYQNLLADKKNAVKTAS